MPELTALLKDLPAASPFPFDLNARRCLKLDLGAANAALRGVDPSDTPAFVEWIDAQIRKARADYAAGGYGEDRTLYEMSPRFRTGDAQIRTLHLGIDLWTRAGTPVQAVLDGVVHSTADNAQFGDYGPTVILLHRLKGRVFHTLYGHLARKSLAQIEAGDRVRAGDVIGWLGEPSENVGWPSHLHFQVVADMEGRRGDYPGVCLRSEAAQWLGRCPDPNLLLRIKALS